MNFNRSTDPRLSDMTNVYKMPRRTRLFGLALPLLLADASPCGSAPRPRPAPAETETATGAPEAPAPDAQP